MFADAAPRAEGVGSAWRRAREARGEEKSTQTRVISTAEAVTQSCCCRDVGIQTDVGGEPAPVLPPPVPVDYAGLRTFLQSVEEAVIRELDKNWKSHAFDGFEVNWADQNETVTCLHSLSYPEAQANDLQVTSVSWNATGAVLACSYGKLGDGDWSTEKSYVCAWNLDRRALDPRRPGAVVEVPGAVMSVAFHPRQPSLIAGGLFSGEVLVWDVSRLEDPLIWRTGMTEDTHTDPVYQVGWVRDSRHGHSFRILSVSTDGKILMWQEERDGRLRVADGFALRLQQIPRSTRLKKHTHGDTAVGVTSLSFSHFEPSVFVVGTEGGCLLKCSTAVETTALLQKSSSIALKAPAQFVFSLHGGPIYSVSCSPFHRANAIGHVFCIVMAANGTVLFGGLCFQGEVQLFDLGKSSQKPSLTIKQGSDQSPVYSLEFNHKRPQLLAAGDSSGVVKIWQLSSDFTEEGPREMNHLDQLANEVID
ncbi:WD repeat-containing protein 34 [Varanus komodoensis]|nr:WD repeat-containing protein 34 [Varanus komodoensis]